MNRLQKKCVIATAGFHLLLLVILLVGPAFFNARQKPDDSQVLDMILPNLIDAQFNSGVKNAQPPAPAPVLIPQPQPQPPAPAPVLIPQPQPQPPAPTPTPTFAQKIEKIFTPEPVKPSPDLTPVEKPEKSQPHKIQINTQLTTRIVSKNSKPDNSRNTKAFDNALKNLRSNLSPATTIDMPGNSSVATASYASIVKSVYDAVWNSEALTLPDGIADKNETVKVSVTIARDGTVVSARIISPSGDATLDASVQKTLDRVSFIAPFRDGMTEKEWTRTISFNPELEKISE